MSETVTRGELVKVAKELNDVLKPDTPIDIKANAAKLDQKIREASTLLEEADEVTDETKAVLNTIGADMPESWKTEPEGEGGEEEQEETHPAEPERSEPVDTAADVKKAKAAKKVADLQAIAKGQGIRIAPPFLKDLKKCRDYVVAKLEDLAENGRVIKPKKEKKAGTGKGRGYRNATGYTRSHALVDALKEGGTREEIVAKSDELFVENGGKSNPNVANYMFGYVYNTLLIIGTISEENGKFTWNK